MHDERRAKVFTSRGWRACATTGCCMQENNVAEPKPCLSAHPVRVFHCGGALLASELSRDVCRQRAHLDGIQTTRQMCDLPARYTALWGPCKFTALRKTMGVLQNLVLKSVPTRFNEPAPSYYLRSSRSMDAGVSPRDSRHLQALLHLNLNPTTLTTDTCTSRGIYDAPIERLRRFCAYRQSCGRANYHATRVLAAWKETASVTPSTQAN